MLDTLQIENLKFSYGQQPILQISQLTVQKGELVFLFGPSGSGKSTLLELIAGILKPQQGMLSILNQDQKLKNTADMKLTELDHFRAENIGYIFQSFNLIPFLSVRENIILPFLFQKQDYRPSELDELIEALGLRLFLERRVSQLSVGQQQRVAVARALLKKPQLILADEPTSALDYDHRENFLNLLFRLCRKNQTTVLFVSHDRSIEKLFDRSINLQELNSVLHRSVDEI